VFGIGMTELMVILVVGLLVLGPKRLPELARSLGRGLAEFRRASNDMRREFMEVADETRMDPLDSAPERNYFALESGCTRPPPSLAGRSPGAIHGLWRSAQAPSWWFPCSSAFSADVGPMESWGPIPG